MTHSHHVKPAHPDQDAPDRRGLSVPPHRARPLEATDSQTTPRGEYHG